MNEQAIGFLLEFENKASAALKEAVSDFDAATAALERAVDAAQAAFTFLEEGTGRVARDMGDAIDAAVKKTDQLKTSIGGVGDVEVQGPDLDPIMDSLNELGDNVTAPLDAGVQEVIDDLNDGIDPDVVDDLSRLADTVNTPLDDDSFLNDLEDAKWLDTLSELVDDANQSRPMDNWLSSLDEAVADMRAADAVDEWMEALSEGVKDMKMADALSAVDELNAKLDQTKTKLQKELTTAFHGAGEAGKNAAESMADDTVAAYHRMTKSATDFIKANAGEFGPHDNTAAMDSFFSENEGDLSKVQDLLRVADKANLETIVQGLVDALGDAALADAFWKPIAANKTVDKDFFQLLRKQFQKETKTPKAWWERLGATTQKFFWPHFRKQGEKATEGIGHSLMKVVKGVFSSPIGQLTAALQISRMIEKVFGPFLEELETIIGQALMPMMGAMIDIIDELRPTILELSKSLEPLFIAFSQIGREIMKALVPAMRAIGDVLRGVIPLLVGLMRLLSGPIATVLDFVAESIAAVTFAVIETAMVVYRLVAAVKTLLQPVIDWIAWFGEITGITKALAFVIGVVLSPLIVALAASSLAMLIGATIKAITVTEAFVVAKWASISAMYTEGLAVLANLTGITALSGGIWGAIKAAWVWVAANWTGIIPALSAAATAVWTFTAALLANPITWIVLAVVAAVGLLVGAVWLLWEPIKAVFNAWMEFMQPIFGLLGAIWDAVVALGDVLLSVVLIPLKAVWYLAMGVLDFYLEIFSAIGKGFAWVGNLLTSLGKMFLNIGQNFIMRWIVAPLKWLASFAAMLIQPLKDAFGWVKDLFVSVGQGIGNFIQKFQWLGKYAAFLMSGPLGWLVWGLGKIAGFFAGDDKSSGPEVAAAEQAVTAVADPAANSQSVSLESEPVVTPQVATQAAGVVPQVTPQVSAGVNYEASQSEMLKAEEFTKPLLDALAEQTTRLVAAMNNMGADDSEDLDLSEMKDIAGF